MKTKHFIAIFAILVCSQFLAGQQEEVQIGDEFTIEAPSGNEYQYILFPRKNFIIKRGGIADMDMVKNLKVVVTDVEYTRDNKTRITLKTKNGSRFFKALFHVKAHYEGALASGELSS